MKRLVPLLAIAVLSMPVHDAQAAATFRTPTLGQAVKALGGATTVPAAWAGIWDNADTTYDCSDLENPTSTGARLDTLCTGEPLGQDQDGFQLDCTGTVTDNAINLTCTGTIPVDDKCNVNFDMMIEGTRTGSTSFVRVTQNMIFVPTFCAFLPNSCRVIETTATRIASEPQACSTPTHGTTWGELKIRYR